MKKKVNKEKLIQDLEGANKKIILQNEEKDKRAAELAIANKELLFQNREKDKRAAELLILKDELFNEKQILEKTLISIGDAVICTDKNYNVTFINRAAESITGWTQSEALGKPVYEVFNSIDEFTRKKSEDIVKNVMQSGKMHLLSNHTILITKKGQEVIIEDSAAPILDDEGIVVGVVIVFRDFREKWKRLKKIEYLTRYDQLTGLYNRGFYEAELIRLDTVENLPLTLIMGDVNGLRLINDSFGHTVGDEVLKKAASLIKDGCRLDDIVARFGGDKFVVILPKTNSYEAEQIIENINDLASKEKIGNVEISISFGYETKRNQEEEIQEVFSKAENYMFKKNIFDNPRMRGRTVNSILNTLFDNNEREKEHSRRVSSLCKSMGEVLGLSEYKVEKLKTVGLLHDIGKISIPKSILDKPGKLTEAERMAINSHSEIGYRILSSVNDLSEMALYVLAHHERWDGKGYPRGLKGEEIPLQSRIIAVADAYDAMTSDRSYRNALPEEVVMEELRKNAGYQFDPDVIRMFVEEVLKEKW